MKFHKTEMLIFWFNLYEKNAFSLWAMYEISFNKQFYYFLIIWLDIFL